MLMPNTSPCPYLPLATLYPYGQLFLLTHELYDDDEIFAYGDLVQADRAAWYSILVYLVEAPLFGAPAPILCPPPAQWRAGYAAGVLYAADLAANGQPSPVEPFAAANHVSPAMMLAGYFYYAYPEIEQLDDGACALSDVLDFLAHL